MLAPAMGVARPTRPAVASGACAEEEGELEVDKGTRHVLLVLPCIGMI